MAERVFDTYPPATIHWKPIFDADPGLELVVSPRWAGPSPWDWLWTIWLHGTTTDGENTWMVESFIHMGAGTRFYTQLLKIMDAVIWGEEEAAQDLARLALGMGEKFLVGKGNEPK